MSDDLVLLPYIQRLYVFWLLEQPEVTDLVDQQVVTDLPTTAEGDPVALSSAWVEVYGFPGRIVEGGSIYWLESSLLQVNCLAGKRHATNRLAETVRAVTAARFKGVVSAGVDDAVITEVLPGGLRSESDGRFPGKPLPRTSFDLAVTAHPANIVS